MGWIYKVTNQVNGKMYIGKTEEVDPLKRWNKHIRDSKRERFEKRPFYDAINKYGSDNFNFEVIDKTSDSNELCQLERYYIDKYRTYIGFEDCNGYNATLGGDGKSYLNLDEDEVIRVHKENYYISGRTAKIFNCDSNTIQKILAKHGVKWLSNKEITRLKFIQTYGGVVKFDYDCTEVISIYETPIDILNDYQTYKEKTMRLAMAPSSKTHHAYGYTWYRLYELPEEYKPLVKEYYASHLDEDNIEIGNDFEYLYR